MAQKELRTNIVLGGRTTSEFDKLGARLESLGQTADRIGSVIREFETDAVNVYRSYEDNMLAAQFALSSQYDDANQLMRIMEGLDQAASTWAASSIFHTDDVSKAINEAAHAGWDYQQILKGIPQAMLIAQAGGLDLSSGLDYLVKMMNATGTEFDDMGSVIDQWAMAANRSATNIDEIGQAFMSMGAAVQFGDSTEELFTLLGILANVGTTGSEAGTALRSAMMRIIAPTTKAENAMDILGADLDEIEQVLLDENVTKAAKKLEGLGFSAYDAEGNLKPMIEIFTELSGLLEGLDEAASNEILAAIFPTRTIAQATAFISAIRNGKMDELFTAIGNSEGYAASGAEIMMSGLTGSIETLKSKWEEFERSIGETLAPTVESIAGFMGDLIDDLNGLDSEQLAALTGAMTGIAAVGPALMVAGGAMKIISTLGPAGTTLLLASAGLGALIGYVNEVSETRFRESFGQVILDLTELGTHVDSLQTKFDLQKDAISEWEAALETAQESYAQQSTSLSKLLLEDMLQGKTLTEEDKSAISTYADALYHEVIAGIENAQASDLSFAQALFGDWETANELNDYKQVTGALDGYYGGLREEAYKLGEKIRDELTEALTDDTLDEQERRAVMASVDRYNEIMAEINRQMDREDYYTQLRKAQSVSWDSVSAYMQDNADRQEQELNDLNDTYDKFYGHMRASYEYALANGTEFTDAYGNTYRLTGSEWNDIEAQINKKQAEARAGITGKYDSLNSAAFDALMNDSGMGDAWQFLKYLNQTGYSVNRGSDIMAMGITPEQAQILGTQLNLLHDNSGRLNKLLTGMGDEPTAQMYLAMLSGMWNESGTTSLGDTALGYAGAWSAFQKNGSDTSGLFGDYISLGAARSRISELKSELAELTNAEAEYEAMINNTRAEMEQSQYGYSATQKFLPEWEREQASLNEQIEETQTELAQLQAQLDALTGEHSIDLRVKTGTGSGLLPFIFGRTYAEGGRADSASIFGEAGPEWAIPEEHSARTADLLNAARQASGFTWGDLIARYGGLNANPNHRSTVINYSPTINAGDASGIEQALKNDKARLMRMIRDALDDNRLHEGVEMYA